MEIPFNITLAQLNPTVGDLDGNADKIRTVRDLNPNTNLIIFPEMIVTGYPADDLLDKPSFIKAAQSKVQNLAAESKDKPALLISAPHEEDGKLFNAAYLIFDGKIQHVVFKQKLPNYDVFDEKRYFVEASPQEPFTFKGHKLGIMICEDMWRPQVATDLKNKGAELLIVVNGSPFQTDINNVRQEHAKARIKETKCPLIYVNQVGGQDDLVFDGNSFVMNENGVVTHQLPAFEEAIYATKNIPDYKALSHEETFYRAVTLGLKDYVSKNGFKGVLIGLSGGIDSALSAAIAVDALGAENVHCVMMPSPYTSQESLDDAAECAKLLAVQLDTISIEEVMTAYNSMLVDHIDEKSAGTTFENIQSRARAILLMALSNATGKMVLSTGNKSEMAVGYATLYGDMCGGYNALKDLYKTQVYKISEWRNTQGKVIPERIITKAPSAELKHDQTDQDTLPPYDVLDDILEDLIEKEMAVDDILHDRDVVVRVARMLKLAEYKRRQAPPGPKVTTKAFGRDRRYPITNGFKKL
jgi:NAD+ synthase